MKKNHYKIKYVPGSSDIKWVVLTKIPGRETPCMFKGLTEADLADNTPDDQFLCYPAHEEDFCTWEVWKAVPSDIHNFLAARRRSQQAQSDQERQRRRDELQREIKELQEELDQL